MITSINADKTIQSEPKSSKTVQQWLLLFSCMVGFLFCFLFCITPLARAGQLPVNGMSLPLHFKPLRVPFLTIWGKWLPADLSLANNHADSLYRTADIELLLFLALAFLLYITLCWWLWRRAQPVQMKLSRRLIWLGAILIGLILVLTPGMASKDLFVYADYGNALGVHGANSYFIPPHQAAPRDTLTNIDIGWSNATSAYGPVWNLIIAFFALLFRDHPFPYFYAYRLLGLACHLVSIGAIGYILRSTGHSERTITLGVFLFAWNPLALFENALGAHNDIFMAMLLLLGFAWCAYTDKKDLTRLKNYGPALIFFTLATMIKFTSLPVVIFFFVLLAAKTLNTPNVPLKEMQWMQAIKNVTLAVTIFIVLSLLFYAPFWIGHSLKDIAHSFAAPPSSTGSENSLMRVAVSWLKETRGVASSASLITHVAMILQSRNLWNKIDALVMAICALLGTWLLWQHPTFRTFTAASLATLSCIILVTPWFYSWYIIWLIALAPVLLAFPPLKRTDKALLAFCIAFSITGFATYIDLAFLPVKYFELCMRYLIMVVPPILLAMLVYLCANSQSRQVED